MTNTKTGVFPIFSNDAANSTLEAAQAHTLDYEAAQKIAAGDMELFEQLYLQHHQRVFGICLRIVRNASEAEDVTQQVFINAFRKIGNFRGQAAFSTWFYRMAVNQSLMHLRSCYARYEQTTDDGELPEPISLEFEKSADVHQVIDRLNLNQALNNLAEGYRKVFILHDFYGFEHDEIARLLGCAAGTSKSQLHKARQKLRQFIKGREGKAE